MNSDDCRDVYLPEGQWVNFFTGERYKGGCWLHDVKVPLDEMPVYVRENAVIPVYPDDVECTDEMDLSKSRALHIDDSFKAEEVFINGQSVENIAGPIIGPPAIILPRSSFKPPAISIASAILLFLFNSITPSLFTQPQICTTIFSSFNCL